MLFPDPDPNVAFRKRAFSTSGAVKDRLLEQVAPTAPIGMINEALQHWPSARRNS